MKHFVVMQRVIVGIISLIIILILGGKILPDIVDQTASETYSEPFVVTTGVDITTTTVMLNYSSYYDDLTGLSATSNNGADKPRVITYDSTTDVVGVAGLNASDSRILTIEYSREAGQQFYGFAPFMRILPFLVIVGGIIACILAIYFGVKSRG